MKKQRILTIYGWIAAFTLSVGIARAADPLRVVYFDYPPHAFVDPSGSAPGASVQTPQGAMVDVWEKHIAPEASVKISWIGPVPFSRALNMLENGEADAIATIARNAEREKKFIIPEGNTSVAPQGLLVLKSEHLSSLDNLIAIQGKTIGILGSGTLPPFLEKNKTLIHIEPIAGEQSALQNIRMLLNGRIWASYFIFADVLLYYAALEKRLDEVKIIPFPQADPVAHATVAISRKLDPAIAERVRKAVNKVGLKYDYQNMSSGYIKRAGGKKP